jgi:hypothetical protein
LSRRRPFPELAVNKTSLFSRRQHQMLAASQSDFVMLSYRIAMLSHVRKSTRLKRTSLFVYRRGRVRTGNAVGVYYKVMEQFIVEAGIPIRSLNTLLN